MAQESIPPMPLLSMSTKEVIDHCANLQDCSDGRKTLFIASYPKSGTTWMQAIIYNLLSNGNQDFGHISQFSPFFEIYKTWDFDDGNKSEAKICKDVNQRHEELGWRVFNTHLRWEMMPKCQNMRYIYVVRNGKDVALSFFKHLSNQDDSDCFGGSLLDFVHQWSEGTIPFGNWVHHLRSWMEAYNRNDGIVRDENGIGRPFLVIRYEDLQNKPLESLLKIIQYLELDISETRAEELLRYVSFEHMKSHENQFQPISVPWKEGYSFIRNGKVGDSANYFEEEHNRVYDDMIKNAFQNDQLPQWLLDLKII